MNWQKMLSDLALTTEKPIDQGIIYLAMLVDLYNSTKNDELRKELEMNFIRMLKIPQQ